MIGINFSVGPVAVIVGFKFRRPYGVKTVSVSPGFVANVGRAFDCPSTPNKFVPDVMLYGDPDCAVRKGLKLMPCFRLTLPPKNTRFLIANPARP